MLRGEKNSAYVNGLEVEDCMDADEPVVGQEKDNISLNLKKLQLKYEGLNKNKDDCHHRDTVGLSEPDGLKLKNKKGEYLPIKPVHIETVHISKEENDAILQEYKMYLSDVSDDDDGGSDVSDDDDVYDSDDSSEFEDGEDFLLPSSYTYRWTSSW